MFVIRPLVQTSRRVKVADAASDKLVILQVIQWVFSLSRGRILVSRRRKRRKGDGQIEENMQELPLVEDTYGTSMHIEH